MFTDSLNRTNTFITEPLIIIIIILIILLLILSGLLTAAEVDYFGAEKPGKETFPAKKANRKIPVKPEKPEEIMATILIANLITNVAVIALASLVALRIPLSGITALILILATAFVILLFAEILPRLFAVRYPYRAARILANPLSFLSFLLRPLVLLIMHSGRYVPKKVKSKNQPGLSVSEITQALELASEDKIPEEKEILEGIVNFGNKNVSEIMCPRVDVVAVDIKSPFTAVLDIINDSGYSRIPAYDGSFDQIRGILYIKDLLPHTDKGQNFQWQKLLRLPYFIPETKKIKDLLEDFQKNKIHLAVVVDEYGGSSGIVTLEDILEEIVGDIADEFDDDDIYFSETGENTFLFDGKTPLNKFYKIVGKDDHYFDEVKREADTLAGLVLEINGDIPRQEDTIVFKDFRFTIETVTSRRIRKVKVKII